MTDANVMLRVLAALSAALSLFLPAAAVSAAEVVPIVFPVDGPNHYSDTWGDARGGGRTHEGTDIMAAKMTPVVAAASGTVGWVSSQCCAMEIVHDDGYRSRYIHLNNDTPGTDDGKGWGFAPGIASGVHVQAGQLVGYVGDSGNAEATSPHLHFELRYADGTAFNSYPSLLVASPPDSSVVTWHVGAIESGTMSVDHESLDLHVRDNGGMVGVGDFDGDGADEVAVGGGYDPGWTVSEMDGSEETWAATDGAGATAVHSGDFDGDGDDDLAVFMPSRAWIGFRSNGSSFTAQSWGSFGGVGWADQLVGDFDGDGRDELLSFHPATRNWWISDLEGNAWRHSVFAKYGTPSGWQVHFGADVDGDGAQELISFHPSNGTWWKSDQGQSPRLVFDVSTNSGWQHLTAADLDDDGGAELVMYHPSNGSWWVVDPGSSPASLFLWGMFTTKTGWVGPAPEDVNGDGHEDIMIRHQPSGRVWAVLGDRNGQLVFLGTLVAGSVEGTWTIAHPDTGSGLLGLSRD